MTLSLKEQLGLDNLLIAQTDPVVIRFVYTNHRSEKAIRDVRPQNMWYGVSEWHGETPALFLEAFDFDKNAARDFKIADIETGSIERLDHSATSFTEEGVIIGYVNVGVDEESGFQLGSTDLDKTFEDPYDIANMAKDQQAGTHYLDRAKVILMKED